MVVVLSNVGVPVAEGWILGKFDIDNLDDDAGNVDDEINRNHA